MTSNVVRFSRARPRAFTTQEKFIARMREEIITSGETYKVLASKAGVAQSTVQKLASGHTKWPRHTTLFPLLASLGKSLAIIDKGER